MVEKLSTDLPGDKFRRSREVSRSAERDNLIGAHNQYETLPLELQDEVDAFSDAITNVTIERIDAEFGDTWYGGADFNKKLTKLIRNFATGFSRDRETLEKALNSSVSERRAAEIAYDLACEYLNSFPNLKELQIEKNQMLGESGITEDVKIDEPHINIDKTPATQEDLDTQMPVKELVLEREMSIPEVDQRIQWLQSITINREDEIQLATDKYLEQYPNNSRVQAVNMVFDYADVLPGVEQTKRRESIKAAIVDNFGSTSIISKEELQRLIDHHEYKYGAEMRQENITKSELQDLFISYGNFTSGFTKENAIQSLG